MPYVQVEDFKQGLDTRRMAVTSPSGSLQSGANVVINRGGEIETVKAFEAVATLPEGTFGLQDGVDTIYVFGSVAAPTMPAGYTYQRLTHPDGVAMTGVVHSTLVLNKPFVIAKFFDGKTLPFYDGVQVANWTDGIVRPGMLDNAGIATHIAGLINAHPDYSAAAVGAVITVTGVPGRPFTIATTATNGGAVDDQKAEVAVTVESQPVISEVRAVGSFRILGGSSAPGVNKIVSVQVNSVTLTSGAINWATSNEETALTIATNINAFTSSPEYDAAAIGDTVTLTAKAGTGVGPNNYTVRVEVAGDVILGTGGFSVEDSVTGNQVYGLRVGGVNIMSGSVSWSTSDTFFATNIAANVQANPGSGFTAFSSGPQVYIGSLISTGLYPEGLAVAVDGSVGGWGTVAETTKVKTAMSNMTGGRAAFAGTAQSSTITISGTFEQYDKFRVVINDSTNGDIVFGADMVSGLFPTFAFPLDSKVYAVAGPIIAASGLRQPTKWTVDTIGAWLKDMTGEISKLKTLLAIAEYQGNVAVFGDAAIAIYNTDPDPDLNTIVQRILNTGTVAPRSVLGYLESDVFYLSRSGVRSLRARDSSNQAITNDVGTPIDGLLVNVMQDLSTEAVASAFAAVDPTDGRALLYLGGTVYVFTFFPTAKISAWTTIAPGVPLTWFAAFNDRLYARGGANDRTVYLYGGTNNRTYTAETVEFTMPYINGRKQATFKRWAALDFAVEGTWDVYVGSDPTNPAAEMLVATVGGVTFNEMTIPFDTEAPSIRIRMRRRSTGYARVSNVTAHYTETKAT